ncbi:MAG: hypothetical protein ACREHD_20045 [Pirellulales bacterium]
MNRIAFWLALSTLVAGGCGRFGNPATTPAVPAHPVFHTPVSGQPQARPAIQVKILDDSEWGFFTAELYLAVQSSRFPAETWVILPLNVGDFAGCRERYVQLPFEVTHSDQLVFNLLDEDKLTEEQEKLVLHGCRAGGYCVLVAGKIYTPELGLILQPVATAATELLGSAIIDEISLHYFHNRGTAEFVVQLPLPADPQSANNLSLMDRGNNVPVVLRLYGPPTSLQFTIDPPAA